MPVCARHQYLRYSGNRHYILRTLPYWSIPSVPSDSTGTIAGNQHYSTLTPERPLLCFTQSPSPNPSLDWIDHLGEFSWENSRNGAVAGRLGALRSSPFVEAGPSRITVNHCVSRSVGLFVGRLIGRSVGLFVDRFIGLFVGRLIGRLIGLSVGRFIGRTMYREIGRSVGLSIGRFIGRSVFREIDRSVGRFAGRSDNWWNYRHSDGRLISRSVYLDRSVNRTAG